MVFICPVVGLSLKDHPDRCFTVQRVTFIERRHFFEDPTAFGIKTEFFSNLSTDEIYSKVFANAPTVALLRGSRKKSDPATASYRKIKEEIDILSMSRLGLQKRRFAGYMGFAGEYSTQHLEHFIFGDDGSLSYGGQAQRLPFPLNLDEHWMAACQQKFFFEFLDILTQKKLVASKWRETLRRAAILIGKSANTNDLALAFLWNMIAFELLLTQQGDSYASVLPARAKAFVGWLAQWDTENWEDRLESLYRLRCQFVHDGNSANVQVDDLLFMDNLVMGIFGNIIKAIDIFPNKEAVINFASKVKAEELLQLEDKLRPNSFAFWSLVYDDEDRKSI